MSCNIKKQRTLISKSGYRKTTKTSTLFANCSSQNIMAASFNESQATLLSYLFDIIKLQNGVEKMNAHWSILQV